MDTSRRSSSDQRQEKAPFVGREKQVARCRELRERALKESSARLVLIIGEAGAGKTRFVSEFAAHCVREGIALISGRCESRGRPYQPVIELLSGVRDWLTSQGVSPLTVRRATDLIEALRGRASTSSGNSSPDLRRAVAQQSTSAAEIGRLALYERIREFLCDATFRQAPIFVFHDLHYADASTRGLVLHLTRTLCQTRELVTTTPKANEFSGLILVTTRPTAKDTAVEWIDWTSGTATDQIELGPFSAEEVREFLSDPISVERAMAATQGVPRALNALLEPRRTDAGESLRAHVQELSPHARLLAQAVALHARPAGTALLTHLATRTAPLAGVQLGDESIRAAVLELQSLGVISKTVVDGDLRVFFGRSQDRDAIVHGLSEDLLRDLHFIIGESLPSDDDELDLATKAHHLLSAAPSAQHITLAIEAAEKLELAFAFDRAAELYERVHATPIDRELRRVIESRLCDLYEGAGDYAKAAVHAAHIVELDPKAPAAHRRLGHLSLVRGHYAEARATLSVAMDLATEMRDSAEELRILADLGELHYLSGKQTAAIEAHERSLTLKLDDPSLRSVRISIDNTRGKVALMQGDYALAATLFRENLALAQAAGLSAEVCRANINRGIAALRAGDNAEAQRSYEQGLIAAETAGDLRHRAICLQNLGVLANWRRDYRRALECYESSIETFNRIGHRTYLGWVALDLGSLYVDLRNVEHAERMVVFVAKELGADRPAAMDALLDRLRGRIALAQGDYPLAQEALLRLKESSARLGDQEELAAAIHQLAEIALTQKANSAAELWLSELTEQPSRKSLARQRLLEGRAKLQIALGSPPGKERDQATQTSIPLLIESASLFSAIGDPEGEMRSYVLLATALGESGDRVGYVRARDLAAALDERIRQTVPEEFLASFDDSPERRALRTMTGLVAEVPHPTPLRSNASSPDLREIQNQKELSNREELSRRASRFPRIVTSNRRMEQIFDLIERVAPHDTTVLIRGESGTGKELIADAIHTHSQRAGGPFVRVNCGALVESLLLSELFGHERGSFTGAHARKKGRFELADQGTIFLDEIGDVSPKTQVALLRVLQEREIERVGGTASIKVDVRIVCATHRDLEAMVRAGTFREDLYYRLAGLQISLPPLRDRQEDLPLLANYFLRRIAAERGGPPKTLTDEVTKLLASYRWPGNIREFENVLRTVSLFADGNHIQQSDFAEYSEIFLTREVAAVRSEKGGDSQDGSTAQPPPAANPANRDRPAIYSRALAEGLSLKELKRRIEEECIAAALSEAGGNITRAAERLGMKRPRLSQLIKEYGISVIDAEGST